MGSSMKRVGFIDLRVKGPDDLSKPLLSAEGREGIESLVVYSFKSISGRFEFEKAIEALPETSSALFISSLTGIKDFYLSLPLPLLNFRILKLPFSEPDRLKEIIPFELDSLIMDPMEQVVFDAIVLGESNGSFEVLVAYANQGTLQDILNRLAALNVNPRVITSLDLRPLLESGIEDLAQHLAGPTGAESGAEDRIQTAREELVKPIINLRTGPLTDTRETGRKGRSLRVMAALALSLGLLIHFNLIAKAVTAKREIASIRKEMRNQYAALFPREKSITDELYLLKSHLKEIQVKGDAIVDVDLLRLLVEISEKKNQRVVLHELSLDRDLITMKGDADSVNEAETMKVALGGLFKEVSFSEIKPSGAGKFFFTMIAKGRRT